jgi:hypothetical protein
MFFWVLAPCRLADRRYILPPSSGQDFSPEDGDSMFLRNVASTYDSTRRQNPKEQHHPHRRENLKSHIKLTLLRDQPSAGTGVKTLPR